MSRSLTAVAQPPLLSIAEAHAAMTAPGARFEMETIERHGRTYRAWKNGPKRLIDLYEGTSAFGHETFMVFEDQRISFEAFRRAAHAFAHILLAAGIAKGERVAIAMSNRPEWVTTFYGAALAGAIVTPLNAWWSAAEIAAALAHCGAAAAVADGERVPRLLAALPGCPQLQRLYGVDAPSSAASPLEDLLGTPERWKNLPPPGPAPVAIDPEDPATLFFTSGTTGRPKGAVASHRAATTAVFATLLSQARPAVRRGAPAPAGPFAEAGQKRTLLAIPLFHVTGCFSTLALSMATGSRLVMMRKWDAGEALRLIAREKITSFGGVPTIAWQVLEHPERPLHDLSSVDMISYGGAPAPAELVRRLGEAFPQARIGCGWGMTETCATFAHSSGADYQDNPESCGPATPVGDMKVVDAAGRTLPVGAVGELWVRGPHVVEGYWDHPEADAASFADGWLKTGDIARIDAQGFCTILDRAKDVVIRGGENIYAMEVESVLHRHPAIVDAALIGLPHGILGEEAAAVVVLKPGASVSEDALKAFVRTALAPFKVPARIVIRREPLPRTASGKILKSALPPLFEVSLQSERCATSDAADLG